jgi:hypothetical protein
MRRSPLVVAATAAASLWLPCGLAQAACPPDGCAQDVTVQNTSDNHAEAHSDNGGLSSHGGRITLGPSKAAARSGQGTGNAQTIRSRRRLQRRHQNAGLTNWAHNNSAATSANTGESSIDASTSTGATDSDVSSTQTVTNVQTIGAGG